MKTLNMLRDGERAIVDSLASDGAMKRRLEDLGFVPGTVIECILHAPSGDPAAYGVRGASIALRRSDAVKIGVK